jgi:hypothetical protein
MPSPPRCLFYYIHVHCVQETPCAYSSTWSAQMAQTKALQALCKGCCCRSIDLQGTGHPHLSKDACASQQHGKRTQRKHYPRALPNNACTHEHARTSEDRVHHAARDCMMPVALLVGQRVRGPPERVGLRRRRCNGEPKPRGSRALARLRLHAPSASTHRASSTCRSTRGGRPRRALALPRTGNAGDAGESGSRRSALSAQMRASRRASAVRPAHSALRLRRRTAHSVLGTTQLVVQAARDWCDVVVSHV